MTEWIISGLIVAAVAGTFWLIDSRLNRESIRSLQALELGFAIALREAGERRIALANNLIPG